LVSWFIYIIPENGTVSLKERICKSQKIRGGGGGWMDGV